MKIDENKYSCEALDMFENKILKLCPFCGKGARVKEDLRFEQTSYNFPKYYVECKGCYIRTKVGKLRYAVERWNTRNG